MGTLNGHFAWKNCLSLQNETSLYKSFIQLILTYGSGFFDLSLKWFAKSNLKKLQTLKTTNYVVSSKPSASYAVMSSITISKWNYLMFKSIKKIVFKFHRGIPNVPYALQARPTTSCLIPNRGGWSRPERWISNFKFEFLVTPLKIQMISPSFVALGTSIVDLLFKVVPSYLISCRG